MLERKLRRSVTVCTLGAAKTSCWCFLSIRTALLWIGCVGTTRFRVPQKSACKITTTISAVFEGSFRSPAPSTKRGYSVSLITGHEGKSNRQASAGFKHDGDFKFETWIRAFRGCPLCYFFAREKGEIQSIGEIHRIYPRRQLKASCCKRTGSQSWLY